MVLLGESWPPDSCWSRPIGSRVKVGVLFPLPETWGFDLADSNLKAVIEWLHLSDLHVRGSNSWSQDQVLESLQRDIAERYGSHNRQILLFVTGDVSYSGKREEYDLAADLIERIRTSIGIGPPHTFVVPGNHDVDREREEDAFCGARAGLDRPSEVDRFFEMEARRRTLFARGAAFRSFAQGLMGRDDVFTPAGFAHRAKVIVGPIRVRVLLLDSSWLAQGGQSDVGRLVVGEQQVVECARTTDGEEACFTFAMMHHPFSWLVPFEQPVIENRIAENANILLRGHVHSEDLREIVVADSSLVVFTAGATFETRESLNTYLWCSLDLETGQGLKVTHRYARASNRWEAQEPVVWNLPSKSPRPIALELASSVVARFGPTSPAYLLALLSGIKSEVPAKLPNGEIQYLPVETATPDIPNPIGGCVLRLRRLVAWAAVWHADEWEKRIGSMLDEWSKLLAGLDPASQQILTDQEVKSEALVETFSRRRGRWPALYASEAIRAAIAERDLPRARTIFTRWSERGVLRPTEILSLRRSEVGLLRAEGDLSSSVRRAREITLESDAEPEDWVVLALCLYESRDYQAAETALNEAFDRGLKVDGQVQTLSLRVAEKTGSPSLRRRVFR